MKFVGELVLKYFLTFSRVEVQEDRRVFFDFEDEAVLFRLDHGINLRPDLSVSRQIRERARRNFINVRPSPLDQRFGQSLSPLEEVFRKHESLKVRILKRTLHRTLAFLQTPVTFALKNS